MIALLNAIKNDDLDSFSKIVQQRKEVLQYSFGRFPLLSLCYLYNSLSIEKRYFDKLSKITAYLTVDEPYECYQQFRKYAKRALRLYVVGTYIVSPIEMLAIMEESEQLILRYPDLQKNQRTLKNINYIYRTLYNIQTECGANSIYIEKVKIPKLHKNLIVFVVCLAFIMSVIPMAILGVSGGVFGSGSEKSPISVYGTNQFISMLTSGSSYYILQTDLTIDSSFTTSEFKGHLDGNGKTLNINTPFTFGFIKKLSGSIKNITLNINVEQAEISSNVSFLAGDNHGTLENINLNLKGNFTENSTEEMLYLSGLALNNYGEVSNIVANVDVNLVGNTEGDCYFSSIIAYNLGNINNITINENSKISSVSFDISGIVTNNQESGSISGVTSYLELTQTTDSENWNPLVAGVAVNNYGSITGAVNHGKISSSSTSATGSVQVAGIALTNYFMVEQCKNYGDIYANSIKYNIFAGGIVSSNEESGSIINCGAFYKSHIKSEEIAYNICLSGGIVGLSFGLVKDCFTEVSFSEIFDNSYFGGIFGAVANTGYSASVNNYFVFQDIEIGIGTVLQYDPYSNSYYPTSYSNSGTALIDSLAALKLLEVYW